MNASRRGFLGFLAGAVAAPAVAKLDLLGPILFTEAPGLAMSVFYTQFIPNEMFPSRADLEFSFNWAGYDETFPE